MGKANAGPGVRAGYDWQRVEIWVYVFNATLACGLSRAGDRMSGKAVYGQIPGGDLLRPQSAQNRCRTAMEKHCRRRESNPHPVAGTGF